MQAKERRRIEIPIENLRMTRGEHCQLSEYRYTGWCSFDYQGKNYVRKTDIRLIGNFSPAWIRFKGYDWQISGTDGSSLVRFAELNESSDDFDQ